MYKSFELLQVYADRYGDIDDVDHIGEIQIDSDNSDDFYELLRNEIEGLGVAIPESWDIVKDEYMGLISIYDTKGNYRYQLRSY